MLLCIFLIYETFYYGNSVDVLHKTQPLGFELIHCQQIYMNISYIFNLFH